MYPITIGGFVNQTSTIINDFVYSVGDGSGQLFISGQSNDTGLMSPENYEFVMAFDFSS